MATPDRRVALTESSARRVAAATIAYERAGRDMPGLRFRQVGEDVGEGPSLCGRTSKYLLSLTADAPCGSGFRATAHVTGDCPGAIDSIEIHSGGTGYARLGRVQPTLQIKVPSEPGATVYTPTFVSDGEDSCGLPAWRIDSVSVSGGDIAPDGAPVTISPQGDTITESQASLQITGGAVVVTDGGRYYEEDPAEDPIVMTVTIVLSQTSPSTGTAASFTAVIDDTVGSPTFGQITSVTIDDGGSGYLNRVWQYDTKYKGLDFADVTGYDGSVRQVLGHEPNGCLQWYNVTTCDAEESGVCCVDGEINSGLTTQAACETAGGTWHAGALADDLPGPCCT